MAPTEVDAISQTQELILRAIAQIGIAAVGDDLAAASFRRTGTQTPQFRSDPSFAPFFLDFYIIRHLYAPFYGPKAHIPTRYPPRKPRA